MIKRAEKTEKPKVVKRPAAKRLPAILRENAQPLVREKVTPIGLGR